jgi:hypothetical protein
MLRVCAEAGAANRPAATRAMGKDFLIAVNITVRSD